MGTRQDLDEIGVRLLDETEVYAVERLARDRFSAVWLAYRGTSLPLDLGDRWWPHTADRTELAVVAEVRTVAA